MYVNRFSANFDSECASCPNDILEDDEAGFVDDRVCCAQCCDEAEAEAESDL